MLILIRFIKCIDFLIILWYLGIVYFEFLFIRFCEYLIELNYL